jgi:hypothetical protein
MNYKDTIKEAWQFAQSNKKMVTWYALIPSMITTVSGIVFFLYQYFSFKKEIAPNGEERSQAFGFLVDFWEYIKANPDNIWIYIVVAVLLLIIYFFYPTFSVGAIIQLTARKKKGQEVKLINGVTYGLSSFLPLFEYHLILRSFSLTAVFTESAFIIRNLDGSFINFLLPIFILIGVSGLFLTLFFTYVEWFIVIDDEGVFSALQKSAKLVFHSWQHTFLILVLLMVIVLRVILNMILVFVIPVLVFAAVGFFASAAFEGIGFALSGIVALISLYIAGYLGGTLSIFSHAVWTFTFLELTENGQSSARDEA